MSERNVKQTLCSTLFIIRFLEVTGQSKYGAEETVHEAQMVLIFRAFAAYRSNSEITEVGNTQSN